MKIHSLALAGLALMNHSALAADAQPLKDQKDKVSYSIGLQFGSNLKREGIELSSEAFATGVKDAMLGNKPLLTEQEMEAVMMAFQKEMMARQTADAAKRETEGKVVGEKNKKDGAAFLAANAKKEGVKTTASGLQYKIIKSGAGKAPKLSDTVTTHYRGTVIDGTEFDSSYKRNEPATFPVSGVIKGWTEALQMMKEGDKWQLFIPSELAYGEQQRSKEITPNSVLIFDIELIKVEAK